MANAGPSEKEKMRRLQVRMYSDLLIRCIANAIYQDDVSMLEKRTSGQIVPVTDRARALGLDWPSRAHSMAGLARLNNLKDLVQSVVDENVPGVIRSYIRSTSRLIFWRLVPNWLFRRTLSAGISLPTGCSMTELFS